MKEMQANGREKVEKLFWDNKSGADKAYTRDPEIDAYWPRGHGMAKRSILWSVVPGKGR